MPHEGFGRVELVYVHVTVQCCTISVGIGMGRLVFSF